MNKYIGKYRVYIERDKYGEPMEFTYLVSTKYTKDTIYRYSNNVLKLNHVGNLKNIINIFNENKIEILDYLLCDKEGYLLFKESDLDIISHIINIKTYGARIKPESIRNHPNYKEIREEKRKNMSEEQRTILADRLKRNIGNIS